MGYLTVRQEEVGVYAAENSGNALEDEELTGLVSYSWYTSYECLPTHLQPASPPIPFMNDIA